MLMNTHFMIANSVIDNIDENKSFFISKKNFIYGNLKPDISSRYVLKKHYLDESLNMIINKIKHLSNLTLDYLNKYFSISKLSQEIGVVCHFLCDFFCVPHSQRWELSHSMNKHIVYERELAIIAKNTDLSSIKGDSIKNGNIEEFFHNLYEEYTKKLDYKNDLLFSTYICNSIVNYILDCILNNTANYYSIKNCC